MIRDAAPRLSLRPAGPDDCARVLAWVNDPHTRSRSFDIRPIPASTHEAWFAALMKDPARLLYIVQASDEPIGYARFEVAAPGEADVSVALDAAWRGRGLGASVLRLATSEAARDLGVTAVHAYVLPGNEPSRRAFAGAGYVPSGQVVHRGVSALRLTARVSPPGRANQ
jgi:UDP-2,4-diacetamido-2,4,6-trideoxy-beta-L-altropyranose hydrolase